MSSFTAYCEGATSVTTFATTMVLIYCCAYSHFSGHQVLIIYRKAFATAILRLTQSYISDS